MKREEEISRAAIKYFDDYLDGLKGESLTVLQTYEDAAKWADKTMIDKICDWLQNIDFEVEYFTTDSDGYTFFNADKFIENFRKAMEE